MTASSVASVKVEREQIERLAQALRIEPRVSESGAALFRRCLERVVDFATGANEPSAAEIAAIERFNERARARAEADNLEALEALSAFRQALGDIGESEGSEEPQGPPGRPRRPN